MSLLRNVLLFSLLAFLPFQDTLLQRTPLRNLGASLSIFPLAFLFALWLLERAASLNARVSRASAAAVLYALVLTASYLLLWGGSFQDTSLVVKSFNLAVIVGLYLFGVFGVQYAPSRWLRAGAMLGFALTLAASLLGPALDGNGLIHSTVNMDARPRGFATESSTFSVQAVISGLLAVYFARRRGTRALFAAITVGLLLYSGSKGGLISLLVCAAMYGAARAGLSLGRLLLGAAVLIPATWFISAIISQGFENDLISNGSSVATRATMALFTGLCVLHNPLGVGFSGFYPAMARYLPDAMSTANSFFNFPLVFAEVSNYQYTMENADCKTLFLNWSVYFGLPFAAAFALFFSKLVRRLYRRGEQTLLIGVLFAAVALTTYYSSMNAYSIPVLLGVCLTRTSYEENPVCKRA